MMLGNLLDMEKSDAASAENKVWFLRKNKLFAQAMEGSVESAEHLFTTCLYPKRARVFDQSDADRVIYLVKRGKVRLSRLTADGKEVAVAILGAGDIIGEEMLFGQTRTTIATCLEESLLCSARAEDLFGLLTRDPQLAMNVMEMLSNRLGDASAAMEDLAYARVPDRLMHLFRRLAEEHGVAVPGGVRLDVRLTHTDIASLIGSTRETVSVELSTLVRSGRVRSDGGNITLPTHEVTGHD